MFNNKSTIAPPPNDTLKGIKQAKSLTAKRLRGIDAKRHSLLRFELFRKIEKFLSLNLRNILISPLEGEKKFLGELCELRNFREGYNLKYICRHSNADLPKQLRCIPLNKFLMLGRKFNLFSETVFSRFTSHFSRKRIAFTLAEVLITLGIIGVIAALTLPNLITQYQKNATVQGLKVAYSLLSQAVQKSISENGEIDNWDYTLNTNAFNETYILPYLKIAKKCDGGKCIKTDNFNGYYELNGNKYTSISKSYVLANGMILMADRPGEGFIVYMIDLNGNKKPNIMGKDIFAFYLLNHQSPFASYRNFLKNIPANLYPGSVGPNGSPQYLMDKPALTRVPAHRGCNKNSIAGGHGGVGSACAVVIMKDGWEISKDYPW